MSTSCSSSLETVLTSEPTGLGAGYPGRVLSMRVHERGSIVFWTIPVFSGPSSAIPLDQSSPLL